MSNDLVKKTRAALAALDKNATAENAKITREIDGLRAEIGVLETRRSAIKTATEKQRTALTAALAALESAGEIAGRPARKRSPKPASATPTPAPATPAAQPEPGPRP